MKRLLLLLVGLLAFGCDAPQANPSPPQKAKLSPTAPPEDIPSNPASIPDFGPLPSGAQSVGVSFSDMTDPVPEEAKKKGNFITGTWEVGEGTFSQNDGGSGQALTIRRITPALSNHYRVDVACWPTHYTGTTPERLEQSVGVMGLIPYYRDETHYLILSARAKSLEAWACEGFVPGIVWPDTNKLLSVGAPPITPNTAITLGADVDLANLLVKVFYNGQEQGSFKLKPEFAKGPGGIAIANNGTRVRFANLRVYNLAPVTQVNPTPEPVITMTPLPIVQITPAPIVTPPPATVRTPVRAAPTPAITGEEFL